MNALEKFMEQGFTFRSLPTYPRHVAVEKYHFAALLEMTPESALRQFSSAGYLLDSEEIALLVERPNGPAFIYKSKEIPADAERLKSYRLFLHELDAILSGNSPS